KQLQNGSISDSSLDCLHEIVMRDGIEITLQIRVIDNTLASFQFRPYCFDGIMCRTTRSETVRGVQKIRLEDRFDDQEDSHLDNAVFDGGDSKRSFSTILLGNVHAFNRVRTIR